MQAPGSHESTGSVGSYPASARHFSKNLPRTRAECLTRGGSSGPRESAGPRRPRGSAAAQLPRHERLAWRNRLADGIEQFARAVLIAPMVNVIPVQMLLLDTDHIPHVIGVFNTIRALDP